jgi:hypothetical protein
MDGPGLLTLARGDVGRGVRTDFRTDGPAAEGDAVDDDDGDDDAGPSGEAVG